MAYRLRYTLNIDFVGDGAGPGFGFVSTAQTKGFTQQQVVVVPGGDSPTIGNFNTALTGSASTPTAGSMAADLNTQINTALAQIQGFSTGGG